jgi:hypothetical protein
MPVDFAPRYGLTSAATGPYPASNVASHPLRPSCSPSHQPSNLEKTNGRT